MKNEKKEKKELFSAHENSKKKFLFKMWIFQRKNMDFPKVNFFL